ncbi:MAG: type III pantothenate kinase [Gemmatimonadaceae bacterium]|nr:type III pantothenate kinase [Gemmatimonadaceae bacterium]
MLIVFDVGNTETTIGLFDGVALTNHWRIMTAVSRTADEFGLVLRGLLSAADVSIGRVTAAAIGSVVPPITDPLVRACNEYLRVTPVVVDAKAALPIRLEVDEPMTVGADRLINTLAASRLFARDTICVDLGTATTFDCITADGVFLGGVIMPGVRSSAETLTRRTSKLPATELRPPRQVIGKRTEECIRAGVLFGAADAIDGIVRRIKAEWPRPGTPLVVATGGLADVLQPYCREFDRVEPFLTLVGLRMAHELLMA